MTQQPQSVSWIPRPYQLNGVKVGISQACLGLLFPPGGGKTSVVYMITRILRDKKFIKRVLVVCPIRPMYLVWPHQKNKFDEFKHLKVNVLHGPNREAAFQDDSADIYVINPEGLDWLFGAKAEGKGITVDPARVARVRAMFDMLVVDESTKFKNTQTKRFKLLKLIIKYFKRRIILTGTPTPRGLLDLFGQIYILDEGQALGRYITHYRTQYFYPGGFGGYEWFPQEDAAERIAAKIAPLTLRVDLKQAGVELPDLIIDDIYVDLPASARAHYVKMENELIAQIEEDPVLAANAAVASGKCRQIANGALYSSDEGGNRVWHELHGAKLDALEDLLEQLQGQPALICYEFDSDRERIAKRISPEPPWISSGNAKSDAARITEFAKGKHPAVMGHPQSISLGIDGLQESCCHIIMFGVTWRLIDYMQVIDRVRRSGSPFAAVYLHRILARDTLDDRVVEVLDSRERSQEGFMNLLRSLRR